MQRTIVRKRPVQSIRWIPDSQGTDSSLSVGRRLIIAPVFLSVEDSNVVKMVRFSLPWKYIRCLTGPQDLQGKVSSRGSCSRYQTNVLRMYSLTGSYPLYCRQHGNKRRCREARSGLDGLCWDLHIQHEAAGHAYTHVPDRPCVYLDLSGRNPLTELRSVYNLRTCIVTK